MTLTDLIPQSLDMSTGDRLRLVADIILAEPEHWDQSFFCRVPSADLSYSSTFPDVLDLVNDEYVISCDSQFCVAGWGVVTTPGEIIRAALESLPSHYGDLWSRAGAAAFGLSPTLADRLFTWSDMDVHTMANLLRALADLPEPRTTDAAINAGLLTPDGHFL